MDVLDELVDVIARSDGSSWDIADHAAALPQRHEEGYRPFHEVADAIYQRLGVEWSPAVLSKYAQTARAFPHGRRHPSASFNAHLELRSCPDRLVRWAAENPDGTLTVGDARNLRGGTNARKAAPDEWRAKFDRALNVAIELAENDPAYCVDAFDEAGRMVCLRFPKALAKSGGRNVLRAV